MQSSEEEGPGRVSAIWRLLEIRSVVFARNW